MNGWPVCMSYARFLLFTQERAKVDVSLMLHWTPCDLLVIREIFLQDSRREPILAKEIIDSLYGNSYLVQCQTFAWAWVFVTT